MNVLNNNENIGPALLEQDRCGYIVQQYIDRPHLIDDLKYDLRLYVFLYGVQPLRIYLHKMAFARFCTEAYHVPTRANLDNTYMHLTNYAINQFANNYQQCEDEEGDSGHKRSLGAILNILKKAGANPQELMDQIKDIIVKTIISS
jgi:tubulin polyglutamylase TTLL6/13